MTPLSRRFPPARAPAMALAMAFAIAIAAILARHPARAETALACPVKPDAAWSATEAGAWSQICTGQVASLSAGQTLSGSFLQTILTDPRFKITLTTAPIVITGARVPDPVIIENATLQNKLYLQNTSFANGLEIYDSTSSQGLVLDGDQFGGPLIIRRSAFSYLTVENTSGPSLSIVNAGFADNLQFNSVGFPGGFTIGQSKIGGDVGIFQAPGGARNRFGAVILLGDSFDGSVSLTNADLSGQLDSAVSAFSQGLSIWHANFADIVSFRDTDFGKTVDVSDAAFARDLRFETSTFKSQLSLSDIKLCIAAKPCELFAVAANFGGAVDISNAAINGAINADGADFAGSLFLNGDSPQNRPVAVTMIGATVGGDLMINATTLAFLQLHNARIDGNLEFDTLAPPAYTAAMPGWTPQAWLGLSGATLGELSNVTWDWPRSMSLTGMRFGQIGLRRPDLDTGCIAGGWSRWLAASSYSPEPYQQLAKYLADTGDQRDADCVQETSRTIALNAMGPLTRAVNWTYGQVAGFGYAPERAFLYAGGFILLGMLVLQASGQGRKYNMPVGFFYSFSQFIPLVSLDKKFDDVELTGYTRWYFYIHKILGWILAGFIAAALSGLASKT